MRRTSATTPTTRTGNPGRRGNPATRRRPVTATTRTARATHTARVPTAATTTGHTPLNTEPGPERWETHPGTTIATIASIDAVRLPASTTTTATTSIIGVVRTIIPKPTRRRGRLGSVASRFQPAPSTRTAITRRNTVAAAAEDAATTTQRGAVEHRRVLPRPGRRRLPVNPSTTGPNGNRILDGVDCDTVLTNHPTSTPAATPGGGEGSVPRAPATTSDHQHINQPVAANVSHLEREGANVGESVDPVGDPIHDDVALYTPRSDKRRKRRGGQPLRHTIIDPVQHPEIHLLQRLA